MLLFIKKAEIRTHWLGVSLSFAYLGFDCQMWTQDLSGLVGLFWARPILEGNLQLAVVVKIG